MTSVEAPVTVLDSTSRLLKWPNIIYPLDWKDWVRQRALFVPTAVDSHYAHLIEVHDPGGLQAATFEPGRVFTIEPQMRLEEEHLGIRLEDMIVITETGYENLSQFVPIEVADIEKAMIRRGLSDAVGRGGR